MRAPEFVRRYQDYSERRARRLHETMPDLAAAVLTRGKFKVFHNEALQHVSRRTDAGTTSIGAAPAITPGLTVPATAVKLEPMQPAIALPLSAPLLPVVKSDKPDIAMIARREDTPAVKPEVILLDSEGDAPQQHSRQEAAGVAVAGARKRRANKEPLSVDERRRRLDEALNLQ